MTRTGETGTGRSASDWVARHPLTAFFILAVGLEVMLSPIGYLTDAHAIIGEAMQRAGLTYRTNYIVAAQLAAFEPRTHLGLFYLIVQPMTPMIAAFAVCAVTGRLPAVRELAARLRPWQRDVRAVDALAWWALCIGLMAALSLCVAAMRQWAAEPGTFQWAPGQTDVLQLAGWFLAAMFLDGGGTGEEIGWRGFAAPILQSRHAPLMAAFLLSLLWSAWHMPIKEDVILAGPAAFVGYYVPFTIGLFAVTVIMLFFSNKLGGTALIGIVIHGLYNDSVLLSGTSELRKTIPEFTWSMVELAPHVVAAVVIVVLTRGRLGFPQGDPGRRVWTWPKASGSDRT